MKKYLILNAKPLYLHTEMTTLNDKTLGIVLSTIPISDHSQFVHLYTEQLGRITCKVPLASRGRRASQLRQLMTPMTVLELVLSGHNGTRPGSPAAGDVLQIREANILRSPYMLTISHPDKASQCLYMAELIDHTVREVEPNANLWQYIMGSLEVLENLESDWANFHLVFTSGLTRLLGFFIDPDSYQPGHLLDLMEGIFTPGPVLHPFYLNAESAKWFHRMLLLDYRTLGSLTLNRAQRSALLDMELAFLSQHIPEMGTLRSVEVLKSLFD